MAAACSAAGCLPRSCLFAIVPAPGCVAPQPYAKPDSRIERSGYEPAAPHRAQPGRRPRPASYLPVLRPDRAEVLRPAAVARLLVVPEIPPAGAGAGRTGRYLSHQGELPAHLPGRSRG